MTTSFPYLKISREFGVPYGEVIRCAQELDGGPPSTERWALMVDWELAVCFAWWIEQDRRRVSCRA